MSYFLQMGSIFRLTDERSVQVHKNLPKGLYQVEHSQEIGFYLAPRDSKELPSKLYGSVQSRASRIMRTYVERSSRSLPTGVLLSGEKGSGKTLLANYICNKMSLPTLSVSEPFTHPNFLKLLTAGGPKIILFDEFEKVYHKTEDQSALLSMLDGQYSTQNLTIATVNDTIGLTKALQNRPSRFYYHYQYTNLEDSFVEEYCKDNLLTFSKTTLTDIRNIIQKVWGFNFDMLAALVEEMNRFGDTAADTIKHINIIPETFSYTFSIVATTLTGEPVKLKRPDIKLNSLDPHQHYFHVALDKPKSKNDDDSSYFYFTKNHLISNDYGTLTYENDEANLRIVLTPQYTNSRYYAA